MAQTSRRADEQIDVDARRAAEASPTLGGRRHVSRVVRRLPSRRGHTERSEDHGEVCPGASGAVVTGAAAGQLLLCLAAIAQPKPDALHGHRLHVFFGGARGRKELFAIMRSSAPWCQPLHCSLRWSSEPCASLLGASARCTSAALRRRCPTGLQACSGRVKRANGRTLAWRCSSR